MNPRVRTVYVLNGPNLDLLGRRDQDVYGSATLEEVERLCAEETERLGLRLVFRQSNHEGVLIEWVHEALDAEAAIVGNFAAYTHTSIAIMDALAVIDEPVVEVHISDIHAREDFRRHSYVSLVADEVIVGQGIEGYRLALRRVAELWSA